MTYKQAMETRLLARRLELGVIAVVAWAILIAGCAATGEPRHQFTTPITHISTSSVVTPSAPLTAVASSSSHATPTAPVAPSTSIASPATTVPPVPATVQTSTGPTRSPAKGYREVARGRVKAGSWTYRYYFFAIDNGRKLSEDATKEIMARLYDEIKPGEPKEWQAFGIFLWGDVKVAKASIPKSGSQKIDDSGEWVSLKHVTGLLQETYQLGRVYFSYNGSSVVDEYCFAYFSDGSYGKECH